MFLFISLVGLFAVAHGFRLLRLPRSQRSRLEMISALVLFTVGLFIFISGLVLTFLPHS